MSNSAEKTKLAVKPNSAVNSAAQNTAKKPKSAVTAAAENCGHYLSQSGQTVLA